MSKSTEMFFFAKGFRLEFYNLCGVTLLYFLIRRLETSWVSGGGAGAVVLPLC